MTYQFKEAAKGPLIGDDMSEDDQNVLHTWRDSLSLLDQRYHDKRLLRMAARSMVDGDFRTSLVEDGNRLIHGDHESPDNVLVKFFVNSDYVLHVVLPPPAGDIAYRPSGLRDALGSRTSESIAWFQDEWNVADLGTKDPNVIGNGTIA
jgi:hypothetical protein